MPFSMRGFAPAFLALKDFRSLVSICTDTAWLMQLQFKPGQF